MWGHGAHTVELPPAVRPRTAPGEKRNLILSVGRFITPGRGHCKRQLDLVHAFADLHRSGLAPGWELAVVGGASAPDREYALAVRRAAQGLPVKVLVNAPGATVDRLLAEASLFWHGAGYAEDDVKGLVDAYDFNDNGLIEYSWGAMTGNDADAVSFHWKPGNMDRAENAYLYSNAKAAAEAYRLGAVQEVVPREKLRDTALELARKIASKSPKALRLAKWSLNGIEVLDPKQSYRFEQDATRPAWTHSVESHSAWTFRAETTETEGQVLLPLLQLDYHLDTDLHGALRGGKKTRLGLTAFHMEDVAGAGAVESATLEMSFDDGQTWRPVTLRRTGDGSWSGEVKIPRGVAFGSLRATGADDAGNAVEQEVIRAFSVS